MNQLEPIEPNGEFPQPVEQFLAQLKGLSEDQCRIINSESNSLMKRLRTEGRRNEFNDANKKTQLSASVQSRLDKLVNRAVREAGVFSMFEGVRGDLLSINVHDTAQLSARALLAREKLTEEEFNWLALPFLDAGFPREIFHPG